MNFLFQVENILRSDRGDFVLCDYGSATRRVVDPQVRWKDWRNKTLNIKPINTTTHLFIF